MRRTHDISIWPLGEFQPAPRATLVCQTQREALRLFELLAQGICTALTAQPGPHGICLTTHTGRSASYTIEACVIASPAPRPPRRSSPRRGARRGREPPNPRASAARW